MATQREQFIELRKSGVSPQDARKKVYGETPSPIANAPVAGQVPTITPTPSVHDNATAPTPTELVNRNQLQVNKNKALATPDTTQANPPAIIQQAQANQQTVTPETQTTAPTQPVQKVETPKVETPVQTQTPTQAPTTPKTTPAPVQVISPRQTAIQQKLTGYAGKTSQQFVDLMKQGQIPSEISSQLAISSPEFQKAQQEYSVFRKNQNLVDSYKSVYNGMTGQQTVEKNPLQEISDKMMALIAGNGQSYVEAFKQTIGGNEAIRTKTEALNATQAEINSKIKARDDYLKELKRNNPKASLSFLTAMAANQTQGINEEILTLQAERDQQSADLKLETELAKGEFDAQVKDMERGQALQNTLLNTQLGLATKQAGMQMEADFARQQAYENLNDPATAINNVMQEYKKLGIPFTTTLQSRLQEFANSGKSLPDYLTQMTESIQASPAYKQYAEMKAGELSDIQKMQLQAQISERADIRNFGQQIQLAQMQGDITRANYLWQIQNDPEKQAKLLDLQEKVNANKSLYDMLGVNVGTYEGNRGYDLAGKKGDPVPAGGNWKVKSVIDANYTSSPYGNSVVMEDENGNTVRYSHLESIGVKPGDTLGFGDIVGTRGNTGNVRGKNGEVLTAEQIKAGRGSHVDVEIKDQSGRLLSQVEQIDYLKNKKPAIQLDANAISIANGVGDLSDLTPTDKKAILPQLEQIINSRMTGDLGRDSVVKSALYKKDVSDSTLQKMTDMQTVAFQLDSIQERLANQKVGPILGQIKELNPYDTEAQVALAELAGITPKVARGIFGEVGVLTDTDIANYQKTLPNLTSTEEKNAFVVDVMKKLLAKGVMNTIETQARGQRNMSPFLDVYDKAKASLNTSSTSKYE